MGSIHPLKSLNLAVTRFKKMKKKQKSQKREPPIGIAPIVEISITGSSQSIRRLNCCIQKNRLESVFFSIRKKIIQ